MRVLNLRSTGARLLLCGALLTFSLFVLLPLSSIVWGAWQAREQWAALWHDTDIKAAAQLSARILLWALPLNLVLALSLGWLLGFYTFPGRHFLQLSLDIPLVISPMMAGMAFLLLFSSQRSPLGVWLDAHGISILFAPPAMALVTSFVSFPYLAREIVLSLQQRGPLPEQAAYTLGAGGWTIFARVTLPTLKTSLVYATLLSATRALGEYGGVSMVSGSIRGRTVTLPLAVQQLFEDGKLELAFLLSTFLLLLALTSTVARTIGQPAKKE